MSSGSSVRSSPIEVSVGGVVLDDQPFAIEDDEVGFRDVVAERVEDA